MRLDGPNGRVSNRQMFTEELTLNKQQTPHSSIQFSECLSSISLLYF